MCTANPAGNWQVIDGGAPENDVVAIRELRPDRLLIVDATDMGLNPGEIRIVDPDDIAEMFLMTTHNMPLNYLIDQLKEDVGGDFPGHSAGYRRFLLPDDASGKRGGGNCLCAPCHLAG
jgi:hydrogenase maturation protease HycI